MKKLIISEEEKKEILQKHANKGLTLSEKISDLSNEELDETMDYTEMDEELDESKDQEVDEESHSKEMDEEMENPMYEKSLTDELDEEPIYELEIEEDDEDAPFEKGPRGMRAARTRADFDPTAREIEMSGVFGKHAEDVPPTTIRYMRKNPGAIIKRLADMYGVDKIKNWLGED